MQGLNAELRDLLDQIVKKYGIDRRLESAVLQRSSLSEDDRDLLIDALTAELAETGLVEGDEPNARGLQIEELIDRVGACR